MIRRLAWTLIVCCVALLAWAGQPPATPQAAGEEAAPAASAARPDPAAVRTVWDFYYNARGSTPLLVDLVPCLEVDDKVNSPTRYECLKPVEGSVKPGTKVSAWTSWLIPENDKPENILVQFAHQGVVRTTRDLSISGKGWRYRTYTSETLSKPGAWEIRVTQGSEELGRAQVEVR